MFCLRDEYLQKIKQAIKDGKFSTEKFNTDSKTRREMLSDIVGPENAEAVNTAYEQKLLLKNQEAAMYGFVKDITGLSAEQKAATLEKVRQAHADKNARLFDPKQGEQFLNEITSDIYSKKYGADVSLEQAQTITELAHDAKVAKEDLIQNGKTGFGAAKVALDNYVGALKIEAKKESTTGLVNPLKESGFQGKVGAIIENAKVSANFIAENSRAIVASLDNSLWFRQGLKALMDPRTTRTWIKDFSTSWQDMGKTIGAKSAIKSGDAILDAVKAEAYERPGYLNGLYEGKPGAGTSGTKLDIATGEESFPTSAPSRIPVFGRFFKASEVAYEAGAMRLRMDIADKFYDSAKKSGVDMADNKAIGDINQTVNMMTGRATFGKRIGGFEKATNVAFFSIKFFKSNLDYLTSPVRYLLDVDSVGKRQAAQNLLYTVATTGIVLKLAQTLNPKDNKDIFNNTSSNFGKIRNGHMTMDLTGGAGGLVVMASKILLQESTSGTTGITKKLGEGYGSQTGMDVLWSFTENKFSPLFSVLKDWVNQRTRKGEKPTILNEGASLVTPIIVQNLGQFKDESTAKQFLGLLADGVGLSTNVYMPTTDWGESTSKEMAQFKAKAGDKKFTEANDLFNEKFNAWFDSVQSNPKYEKLSDEEKTSVISKKKEEIKDGVFRHYGFTFKPEKKKKLPNL